MKAINWILSHKTQIAHGLTGLTAASLQYTGPYHLQISMGLAVVTAFCYGSGLLESDKAARDRGTQDEK
jgi:hypothetical protein